MLARIKRRPTNSDSTSRRWRRVRIVLLVAALGSVLTGTALASASKTSGSKTTPPLLIGRGHDGYYVDAQLLVASHGTVNAV